MFEENWTEINHDYMFQTEVEEARLAEEAAKAEEERLRAEAEQEK